MSDEESPTEPEEGEEPPGAGAEPADDHENRADPDSSADAASGQPTAPIREQSDTDANEQVTTDPDEQVATDPDEQVATDPDEQADDGSGGLVTRRRVLGAAIGTLGTIGGGVGYVYWSLQGDSGGYTAPEGFPVLDARDAFPPEWQPGDGEVEIPPEPTGEWPDRNADAPIVLFVHGFGTDHPGARDQGYTTRLGLADAGRELPVVTYSWDSDREWEPAKAIAERNGRALARWLREWDTEGGRPIHVFGYSLGARVSAELLVALAEEGGADALQSVSLLGGAIPHDSVEQGTRYGDAIAAGPPTRNFHSGRDHVLGWIYRFSDGTKAVGSTGIRDSGATPAGYEDVDVTSLVGDHYSYFEPEEGCLPEVVDRLG